MTQLKHGKCFYHWKTLYFMKELLLIAIIHGFLVPVQTINGVIWNKMEEKFVPIFSIPAFALLKQERIDQSRKLETHNFEGRSVRFTYFQEANIVEANTESHKVTGLIGEIWNTLSEALNFTLTPIQTYEGTLGITYANKSFSGLLGIIERNETDVIPKVEPYVPRLTATRFTIPLWKNRYRLYIRWEVRHNPGWMLKLFSTHVWRAIVVTYFLMSYLGLVSQITILKMRRKNVKATCKDHLFYNFGMICSQSYIPHILNGRSRMLELCLGIFSFVIKTAFSALLIGYMTQKVTVPPFDDLVSLLNNTSYDILSLSGSLTHLAFQRSKRPVYRNAVKLNRVVVAPTVEEMYEIACLSKKKYAIFEAEDEKKVKGLYICRLNPTGIPYLEGWVTSGVSWDFTYKRSIDMGILKLHEFGFIAVLKYRWMESKNVEEEKSPYLFEPIDMEQTSLILSVFLGGVSISLITLILENIFFYRHK